MQALQQENLPKIEPITKQFKLLMRVAESSQEQQGILVTRVPKSYKVYTTRSNIIMR